MKTKKRESIRIRRRDEKTTIISKEYNNKQIKRKKKQTEVNIKKIDKKTSIVEREKRREKTKRGR